MNGACLLTRISPVAARQIEHPGRATRAIYRATTNCATRRAAPGSRFTFETGPYAAEWAGETGRLNYFNPGIDILNEFAQIAELVG
jgi:hypothetical protein